MCLAFATIAIGLLSLPPPLHHHPSLAPRRGSPPPTSQVCTSPHSFPSSPSHHPQPQEVAAALLAFPPPSLPQPPSPLPSLPPPPTPYLTLASALHRPPTPSPLPPPLVPHPPPPYPPHHRTTAVSRTTNPLPSLYQPSSNLRLLFLSIQFSVFLAGCITRQFNVSETRTYLHLSQPIQFLDFHVISFPLSF